MNAPEMCPKNTSSHHSPHTDLLFVAGVPKDVTLQLLQCQHSWLEEGGYLQNPPVVRNRKFAKNSPHVTPYSLASPPTLTPSASSATNDGSWAAHKLVHFSKVKSIFVRGGRFEQSTVPLSTARLKRIHFSQT